MQNMQFKLNYKIFIYLFICGFQFFGMIDLFSQTSTPIQIETLSDVNSLNNNAGLDSSKTVSITDTTKAKSDDLYMSKSPTGALVRSLIIPGWGQYYVESYWKAPIFILGAGTLVYFIASNHSEFVKYNDKYNGLADKNTIEGLNLKSKKEFYRDNRDMSAFYLLAVYALSAVDAYVDAHLFDFNVDDNLSLNFSPNRNGLALNLNYIIK